ncbi:MAG: hypothetical protein Q9209_006408 [Squamulea sp. 1 TL-2023]
MDVNEQDRVTDDEPSQKVSQDPNGHPNPDPSVSTPDNHPDVTSNGMLFEQPNDHSTAQPNGTQDNQASGVAETQTPPSGQGNSIEEEPIDPKEPLEPFGWDDLEERFVRRMDECQKQEAQIEKEFREWCLTEDTHGLGSELGENT